MTCDMCMHMFYMYMHMFCYHKQRTTVFVFMRASQAPFGENEEYITYALLCFILRDIC